jgi:hypothetical protein
MRTSTARIEWFVTQLEDKNQVIPVLDVLQQCSAGAALGFSGLKVTFSFHMPPGVELERLVQCGKAGDKSMT